MNEVDREREPDKIALDQLDDWPLKREKTGRGGGDILDSDQKDFSDSKPEREKMAREKLGQGRGVDDMMDSIGETVSDYQLREGEKNKDFIRRQNERVGEQRKKAKAAGKGRLAGGMKIGKRDLKSKKQITFIGFLVVSTLILPAEIADIFSLTGWLSIVSWLFDIYAALILVPYLWYKGKRLSWNMALAVIASAVEFIPVLDLFPLRILTLFAVWALGKNVVMKAINKKGK